MSFYNNFISLCNKINKTPSKVVLEIGLKKSAVTRWKSGGNPTDATAQKIADYFGVSVSELTGEGQKEKPTAISGGELDPLKKEAWDLIQGMDNETLERFIKVAKAMLGE